MPSQNSRNSLSLYLKLLAPYLSVIVFWLIFHNAWLALLGYHLQTIFWLKETPFSKPWPDNKIDMAISLAMLAAGPFIYFILPLISKIDLSTWLSNYQLNGWLWLLIIPYFGLLHPFLEQAHWGPLREKTPASHFFFAGYHAIVLYSLLPVFWLLASFVVLTVASFIWQRIAKNSKRYSAPVLSHILADFGLVIAAWLLLR